MLQLVWNFQAKKDNWRVQSQVWSIPCCHWVVVVFDAQARVISDVFLAAVSSHHELQRNMQELLVKPTTTFYNLKALHLQTRVILQPPFQPRSLQALHGFPHMDVTQSTRKHSISYYKKDCEGSRQTFVCGGDEGIAPCPLREGGLFLLLL